jgi:hypothetical protein
MEATGQTYELIEGEWETRRRHVLKRVECWLR